MKDWKTYAIVILAAWCILLTCRKSCQNAASSADIGTPIDCTDSPPVWSNNLQHVEWSQGGEKGFILDCYCKIAPLVSGSNYTVFQRCRLTFSKDGLLVKSELLPESVRLTANCRADRKMVEEMKRLREAQERRREERRPRRRESKQSEDHDT